MSGYITKQLDLYYGWSCVHTDSHKIMQFTKKSKRRGPFLEQITEFLTGAKIGN